jgi:glycosyltransferase involved in cell wall biosynthesis
VSSHQERIRVLYVINNLLIGGAQELVKTLSLNLNKDFFEVSVCSLVDHEGKGSKEPLTEEIASEGIDITTLYMKGEEDKEETTKFTALLRNKRADVLHVHLSPADLWICRLGQSSGVPVKVYTKHETYHNKSLRERLLNAFHYNRFYDRAIAISDISVQHLKKYEFIFPWKIKKIFNPVDTERFDPARISGGEIRREFGIPARAPVIGNVARFVSRKGIPVFIETASQVIRKVPDAWFLLVGYGEEERLYEELIADHGIRDHFVFAGPRRDIPNILAAVDIFLFTPLWGESLPLTLLEAMSMGKAIVASNVCSNREIIIHEVSGLLPTPTTWSLTADKLDINSLVDSVIRLIECPSMREEFGKKARIRATEVFSVPVIMQQLEELYTSLLTNKR